MMKITAHFIDIRAREIYPAVIMVEDGIITAITKTQERCSHYVLPGFIDAHIHIESSMLVPTEFARLASIHGTVATVSDPHEISNVLGREGVRFMLDNAEKTAFKFYFGASPCVPATPFETSGAELDIDDITQLLQDPHIKFLSEVMNFPGVVAGDKDMLSKIAAAKNVHKPVDGHAPGLRGAELDAYIAAGISTDHEAFSYEEGLEKLQKGMKILIREGSAAKNFDALHPLIDEHHKNMMFCSDDRHPNDLLRGHINTMVSRAVALGHDLFDVLEMACLNPVSHYDLDVGTMQVGDPADFIVIKELEHFEVMQTIIGGETVADSGQTRLASIPVKTINNFHTTTKTAKDFYLPECEQMEVIQVVDHELMTYEKVLDQKREDVLKIAVINRYEDKPVKGIAHVKGFTLEHGAIASSVAHDSHNIIVVGCSDEMMAKAANLVIEAQGGISAVDETESHLLPLNIAGIMSSQDGFEVAKAYEAIDHFVKESLHSHLSAPFMTLSFMALLVIPELKLSDQGLFDGRSFHFVSPCKK